MLPQPHFCRRELLSRSFNGIGALALGGMLLDELPAADAPSRRPLAAQSPHHIRKAKHCIFLFMQGGVSQVDSFEYKPVLRELHGKPLPRIPELSGELQGRLSASLGDIFRNSTPTSRHTSMRWRSFMALRPTTRTTARPPYTPQRGVNSQAARPSVRGSATGWERRTRICHPLSPYRIRAVRRSTAPQSGRTDIFRPLTREPCCALRARRFSIWIDRPI